MERPVRIYRRDQSCASPSVAAKENPLHFNIATLSSFVIQGGVIRGYIYSLEASSTKEMMPPRSAVAAHLLSLLQG